MSQKRPRSGKRSASNRSAAASPAARARPPAALPGATRFVVLIDWENLSLPRAQQLDVVERLLGMLGRERVRVAKAFATDFGDAVGRLTRMGIQAVSEPRIKPGKNITDMALATHAFAEAVHDVAMGLRSTFVIVSGDSDFYLVARALRSQRFPVVGVVRDNGAAAGLSSWYDLTVPLAHLKDDAPAAAAPAGAPLSAAGGDPQVALARQVLARAKLPALPRATGAALARALAAHGGGKEREVIEALSARTEVPEAEVERWLRLAVAQPPVTRKRGVVGVPEDLDADLLHREVDARLVRRLRRHKQAFELRDPLREVLGFADAAQSAEIVGDLVRGWDTKTHGPLDAGRLRHELMQGEGVEPWFLGYGRVRRFFATLEADGVVRLVRRGSSLVVAPPAEASAEAPADLPSEGGEDDLEEEHREPEPADAPEEAEPDGQGDLEGGALLDQEVAGDSAEQAEASEAHGPAGEGHGADPGALAVVAAVADPGPAAADEQEAEHPEAGEDEQP